MGVVAPGEKNSNNNNNDNYTLIDNNYGRLQDLILLLKIPMRTRNFSSKFINNFGTRPQNLSPALL